MKFSTLALAALAAPMVCAAPAPTQEGNLAAPTRTDKSNGKPTNVPKLKLRQQARRRELIKPSLYPTLQRYTRFAVASLATFVYGLGTCASPPFNSVLVRKVTNMLTDTQVAVFQDDAAREFIVSFSGTSSIQDFGTDLNFFFMPFDGVPGCDGCQVHGGVLEGWKSVKDDLVAALGELRAEKPGYRTVVVGHSLGGGLASMAFTDLKANGVRVDAAYTMGALRIGNQAYADFTDRLSGASDTQLGSLIRITHGIDGVPGLPTMPMGFQHTRTEIYEKDTALLLGTQSAGTTFRCFGQEAMDCNKGTAIGFINQDHLVYTGISMVTGEQCASTDEGGRASGGRASGRWASGRWASGRWA